MRVHIHKSSLAETNLHGTNKSEAYGTPDGINDCEGSKQGYMDNKKKRCSIVSLYASVKRGGNNENRCSVIYLHTRTFFFTTVCQIIIMEHSHNKWGHVLKVTSLFHFSHARLIFYVLTYMLSQLSQVCIDKWV